jgi:hypothetical protein
MLFKRVRANLGQVERGRKLERALSVLERLLGPRRDHRAARRTAQNPRFRLGLREGFDELERTFEQTVGLVGLAAVPSRFAGQRERRRCFDRVDVQQPFGRRGNRATVIAARDELRPSGVELHPCMVGVVGRPQPKRRRVMVRGRAERVQRCRSVTGAPERDARAGAQVLGYLAARRVEQIPGHRRSDGAISSA